MGAPSEITGAERKYSYLLEKEAREAKVGKNLWVCLYRCFLSFLMKKNCD